MAEGDSKDLPGARQFADLWWLLPFSLLVNLFALAGPIFAVQVFDRVLSSRSIETLMTLFAVLAIVVCLAAAIDHARKRLLERAVLRWLSLRVAPAILADLSGTGHKAEAAVDAVARISGSRVAAAVIDVPWTLLFGLALWLLHPALAMLGVVAAAALLLDFFLSCRPDTRPDATNSASIPPADVLACNRARQYCGYRAGRILDHWRSRILQQDSVAARKETLATFRLLVQSATIAVGAMLVIRGEMSAGMIVAASFLMARGLGPLDVIAQNALAIRQGWRAACMLRGLPRPEPENPGQAQGRAGLLVSRLDVKIGRRDVLKGLDLKATPGEFIGILGSSGSGKSVLAASLCGLLPGYGGEITRSGMARDVRLLRQNAEAGCGTVLELVTCGSSPRDPTELSDALRQSGLSDLLKDHPDGMNAEVRPGYHQALSGLGKLIALARTILGAPGLVVLDEPETGLDEQSIDLLLDGLLELTGRGAIVILLTSRPAMLRNCNRTYLLAEGRVSAVGASAAAQAGRRTEAFLPRGLPAVSNVAS